MDSIFIYELLDTQLPLPLQIGDIIIFSLRLPPTIIQKPSSQLLQLSTLAIRIFENSVE